MAKIFKNTSKRFNYSDKISTIFKVYLKIYYLIFAFLKKKLKCVSKEINLLHRKANKSYSIHPTTVD